MKYKLVVFDMDGTILNTLDDLADSLNYALEKNGCPLHTIDEVRLFVGSGIAKMIERGAPADADKVLLDAIFADFMPHYKVHCADKTRPYDGVIDLIKQVRDAGCKTAVVSNKPDAEVQELCHQYFKGLFDIAVGERAGLGRKPSPDLVNVALNALSMTREDAVYVGDSDVDVATARNSKLDLIAVEWGFRTREVLIEQGAENIAATPTEVFEYLK